MSPSCEHPEIQDGHWVNRVELPTPVSQLTLHPPSWTSGFPGTFRALLPFLLSSTAAQSFDDTSRITPRVVTIWFSLTNVDTPPPPNPWLLYCSFLAVTVDLNSIHAGIPQ